MEEFYCDWYEIIEEQSDGHVAFMALDDLDFYLQSRDPNGFLVVDINKVPNEVKPFLDYDAVKPIKRFSNPNKLLLQNNKLSKYLVLAKAFNSYSQRGSDYVEILFERKQVDGKELTERSLDLDNLDNILHSAPVQCCWELFATGKDKELVGQILAEIETQYTRKTAKKKDDDIYVSHEQLGSLLDSFIRNAVLAVVYVWFKKFETAKALIDSMGWAPVRYPPMTSILRYYLELLFANEQESVLASFFEEQLFRDGYRTHYEIYIQTFVDPDFVCTRTQQARIVHERIETFREDYL
ncbi:MAG TPA: hypothetical protein VL125_00020 [Pelobium sp.]|nr:hypothetical protein [Pelobium sp.]